MIARVFFLTFLLILPLTAKAEEPKPLPLQCDIALFKDFTSDRERLDKYLFVLDLVTSDNYEETKRNIDTSWDGEYGFFKGDYASFDQKRQQYRQQHQMESRERYSRDYILSSLTSNGLEAYKACLERLQPESSLFVYRANNSNVDKYVTFNVTLKTSLDLRNFSIDVIGGGALVSSLPPDMRIDRTQMHITGDRFVGTKQFTFERKSYRNEFIVSAQVGGLAAIPLVVGPTLVEKEVWTPEDLDTSGSFTYLSRVPENDRVYAIDGFTGPGAIGTFVGNMCLCASKSRKPPTASMAEAGACQGEVQNFKLDPATVTFDSNQISLAPASFNCANQTQGGATRTRSDVAGVCYTVTMSLNADVRPSKGCQLGWHVHGTGQKKSTIYVEKQ
jgi:hypothetical protein